MSNKFSQLVFQGHLWRSVLRICICILGIKGFKTSFIVQEEEKKRQEKEELLSKKLHEEQALHEAQLKEVSSLHLIWNQIQYWRIWWFEGCSYIYLFVCLFVCRHNDYPLWITFLQSLGPNVPIQFPIFGFDFPTEKP